MKVSNFGSYLQPHSTTNCVTTSANSDAGGVFGLPFFSIFSVISFLISFSGAPIIACKAPCIVSALISVLSSLKSLLAFSANTSFESTTNPFRSTNPSSCAFALSVWIPQLPSGAGPPDKRSNVLHLFSQTPS